MAHFVVAFATSQPVFTVLLICHAAEGWAFLFRQWMHFPVYNCKLVAVRALKLVWLPNFCYRSLRQVHLFSRQWIFQIRFKRRQALLLDCVGHWLVLRERNLVRDIRPSLHFWLFLSYNITRFFHVWNRSVSPLLRVSWKPLTKDFSLVLEDKLFTCELS